MNETERERERGGSVHIVFRVPRQLQLEKGMKTNMDK